MNKVKFNFCSSFQFLYIFNAIFSVPVCKFMFTLNLFLSVCVCVGLCCSTVQTRLLSKHLEKQWMKKANSKQRYNQSRFGFQSLFHHFAIQFLNGCSCEFLSILVKNINLTVENLLKLTLFVTVFSFIFTICV